jgi:NAD-dependent deacetylase
VIAPDLRSGVEQLGDMIAEAATIVPFTGAGISTECGIPDFRSPGGLWSRNRPIPFDEFVASAAARDEAWRRRFAMEPTFAAAKPGRGHRALASLYRAGKIPAIVTQNIDNLHQMSSFTAIPPTPAASAAGGPMIWRGPSCASKKPAGRRTAPTATSR